LEKVWFSTGNVTSSGGERRSGGGISALGVAVGDGSHPPITIAPKIARIAILVFIRVLRSMQLTTNEDINVVPWIDRAQSSL